jgi:hypothetical protein
MEEMDMNDKEKVFEEKDGSRKHRSPGFPLLPIDEAISRLKTIYQHDRRAYTSGEAILSHLGYKGGIKSGTAGRVLSAFKQYGLLEEKSGQFRVSEPGFRILHLADDETERKTLIREAALLPSTFERILSYYEGEIPSDASLKSHLVLNERFNPDSIDQFIRVFRQTMSVANLLDDGYKDWHKTEEQGKGQSAIHPNSVLATMFAVKPVNSEAPNEIVQQPPETNLSAMVEKEPKSLKVYNFPIARDLDAAVTFSNPAVTQEAIEKLSALLLLSKDIFPTKAELEKPRFGVWSSKDHDLPVTGTGAAGAGQDGRQYVAIEGSTTAVPEDEIEYEKN